VPQEAIKARVMEELRTVFRPEFINRIDEVIVFHPLSHEHIRQIAEAQLARLHTMLADRRMTLEFTPRAYDQLAEEGYDPMFGARPLKRVIQQRVQNPLALSLLQGEFGDGDTIQIDAAPDGDFIFSKGAEVAAIV
jgi:ATP-dependent Clp protease ATP-binding subunit ClpB